MKVHHLQMSWGKVLVVVHYQVVESISPYWWRWQQTGGRNRCGDGTLCVSFTSQQRETKRIQEVTSHRSLILRFADMVSQRKGELNQLSDHTGWFVVNWHLAITISCSMANVLMFLKHSKDKHYWRSIKRIMQGIQRCRLRANTSVLWHEITDMMK